MVNVKDIFYKERKIGINMLSKIWTAYSNTIAILVTIILFLFVIIGGEFHLTIYWHHIKEFLHTIRNLWK